MNIGIIHGFVGGGGGTEKTLYAILDALDKTSHNVTLYTFSKPNIQSDRIRVKNLLPISIPAFGLYQRAMESKLISKAKDEDILIQASGGLGIPQRKNQKIIVYCHSDFSSELENPSTKYRGIWSFYYKSYHNMVKKFIQSINDPRIHLISNSKYVHDSIQEKLGKDSEIIYPPVDLSEFSPHEKKNQVVTVGRYSEEKNLEFGIDVMKEIDCDYYIIGNTKTKSNTLYYEKLDSRIKKEKLEQIKLLKDITRKDLVDIINHTKVYFHCSQETFGISVVEGIAGGCIPIVPNISGHIETVQFSELRYTPNDITESKEKIHKAIQGTYDHLLPKMQQHIQKFDKKEFDKQFIPYLNCFDKPN